MGYAMLNYKLYVYLTNMSTYCKRRRCISLAKEIKMKNYVARLSIDFIGWFTIKSEDVNVFIQLVHFPKEILCHEFLVTYYISVSKCSASFKNFIYFNLC